jgi:tRNA modification GTPase
MHDRALRTAESADLVLLVHDVADTRPPPPLPREPDLRIHTKLDRLTPADRTKLAEGDIAVSALTGENLDRLRERLDALAFGAATPAATLALSARHVRAIDSAREAAARALPLAEHPELAAMELREALDHLGQILGQISPDDLLGQIFAKFCIGK